MLPFGESGISGAAASSMPTWPAASENLGAESLAGVPGQTHYSVTAFFTAEPRGSSQ